MKRKRQIRDPEKERREGKEREAYHSLSDFLGGREAHGGGGVVEGVSLEGTHPGKAVGGGGLEPGDGGGEGEERGGEAHSQVLGIHLRGREEGERRGNEAEKGEKRVCRRRESEGRRSNISKQKSFKICICLLTAGRAEVLRCVLVVE